MGIVGNFTNMSKRGFKMYFPCSRAILGKGAMDLSDTKRKERRWIVGYYYTVFCMPRRNAHKEVKKKRDILDSVTWTPSSSILN